MNPSVIIEKWDGLLYSIYNALVDLKVLLHKPSYIKKNKYLREKHEGERCFIIMNGPSIREMDLSYLKEEIVFASNYFYRSDLARIVEPNYYCWADSRLFRDDNSKSVIEEIKNNCPNATLILHRKAYEVLGEQYGIHYVYCRHMANVFGISTNLAGNVTNFSTVAFHAICEALYMGFKEIYVLGLDFAPGAFKHFANLGVECSDPLQKSSKFDVAGNYWNYTKAHYESFYLRDYADKHQQRIINLNPDSHIRAFEFETYDKLFK